MSPEFPQRRASDCSVPGKCSLTEDVMELKVDVAKMQADMNHMLNAIDRLTATVDLLSEAAARGKGAFGVMIGMGGVAGAIVSWIAAHITIGSH